MKAKVKSLGSVVDLSEYVYDEDGNQYTWDEVELIDDDKWQHYRIQAAIAAMQGMIANPQTFEQLVRDKGYKEIRGGDKSQIIAIASVMYADALIAELQKKGD